MYKPKSYLDYAKQFVSSMGTLEQQQAYNREKIRAMYQSAANDYTQKLSLENANKERQKSLTESAVASERARQYVDAVNKHLGIAGTGYAESKAIDLYSQEAQRRQEINENYNTQVNEINKNALENELDFAKQYNDALNQRDETLGNNKNLVIDYLFSVMTAEQLENLPDILYNDDYFQKLFYNKFIKKPSNYDWD